MAVTSGTGAFNVGRDCQIVITHSLAPGGRVDLPNLTMFDCKQTTANQHVDRLDGTQMNAELPKGWTLSFGNDRGNAALDDFFAAIEAAWYNAGSYTVATVFQYITEASGQQTTYQYDNVALKFDDPGSWASDGVVKQRVSGQSNRRVKV